MAGCGVMTDEGWMRLAIEQAKQGRGTVEPNPAVGAVIVEDNQEVARAHHKEYGGPHAEVLALKALGRPPKAGAVMYVTLEPCSTQGRTGACTDVLIASGITTVVLGAIDPNPAHRGKGITMLKNAGLSVRTGVLENECTALNPEFNARMLEEKGKRVRGLED